MNQQTPENPAAADPTQPAPETAGQTKPKRPARRRKAKPKKTQRPQGPDVPYWIPQGAFWEAMTEGARQAVQDVLVPAYRRFVLEAPGELERSVGLTLVYLMWLESCDQVNLAINVSDRESPASLLNQTHDQIAQHIHLLNAKCSTAELLVKFQMLGQFLQRQQQPAVGAFPAFRAALDCYPQDPPPIRWDPASMSRRSPPSGPESGKMGTGAKPPDKSTEKG